MEVKHVCTGIAITTIFLFTFVSLYQALQFVLPLPTDHTHNGTSTCKPIPGEPCWPAVTEWQALNESIFGRLIAPMPPAAICHSFGSSEVDSTACGFVREQWSNSTWHASDPVSTVYNDETCLPDQRGPCSPQGYPSYVVNASSAHDVQEGIKFAQRTGVRLIVKGTGHDFIGRSAGGQSLSIWTHHIRGIEFQENDDRAKEYGAQASMKVYAGTVMSEYYAAAARYNVSVVGGADPNVGIGGWITGGGHSPLSSRYGLGADQALEMEVVTANGTFLTINPDSYPDLFWAMRGGGGSTFAVLISVTMMAYPDLSVTAVLFSHATTSDSDTFWSLAAHFHRQLPALNDAGVMGYYFVTPTTTKSPTQGDITGLWLIPDKTRSQTQEIFDEFDQALNQAATNWPDDVFTLYNTTEHPSFSAAWLTMPAMKAGINVRLASRLLDRKALATNQESMKALLRRTTPEPTQRILGHLVAGEAVRNAKIPGGSNAVLPAWRDAIVHMVIPRMWTPLDQQAKLDATTRLRDVDSEALYQLAPNTGAYMNEADPTDPNWRENFFGDNYDRLLTVKNDWDPEGVFWCMPCVGHERWRVESDYGVEGGIGQTPGRICRV